MHIVKKISRKANQIRKQNWSAPAIMAAFICICMIIVFSFESIGILQKEKNLEFRNTTPEKIIKIASYDVDVKTSKSTLNYSDKSYNNPHLSVDELDLENNKIINKVKIISEKSKEQNLQQLVSILVEGAQNQAYFEHLSNDMDSIENDSLFEIAQEFYDI